MVPSECNGDEAFDGCWYQRFSLTHSDEGEVPKSHMDLFEQVLQPFLSFLDSNEGFKGSTSVHECIKNIVASGKENQSS
jgi:hypothetical protein